MKHEWRKFKVMVRNGPGMSIEPDRSRPTTLRLYHSGAYPHQKNLIPFKKSLAALRIRAGYFIVGRRPHYRVRLVVVDPRSI